MKNKQTTRVLLFWSFYTPASLMIWLLTEGQIIELVGIMSIGIMIVLNYLAINLLFDKLEKNKKKVKDDPLLAFRILFSEKPLEAKK
jgi:hypothetical protein